MVVDTRSTTTMTSSGALEHVLGNVLGYPDEHQVRFALNYFGVTDINALTLFKDDDFTLPYLIPDPIDATQQVEQRLVPVLFGKRLNDLIRWYYSQPVQKLNTWYNLTADSFQTWYDTTMIAKLPPDETPSVTTLTASTTRTFRNSVKIHLTDYPILKEDKHWRT